MAKGRDFAMAADDLTIWCTGSEESIARAMHDAGSIIDKWSIEKGYEVSSKTKAMYCAPPRSKSTWLLAPIKIGGLHVHPRKAPMKLLGVTLDPGNTLAAFAAQLVTTAERVVARLAPIAKLVPLWERRIVFEGAFVGVLRSSSHLFFAHFTQRHLDCYTVLDRTLARGGQGL